MIFDFHCNCGRILYRFRKKQHIGCIDVPLRTSHVKKVRDIERHMLDTSGSDNMQPTITHIITTSIELFQLLAYKWRYGVSKTVGHYRTSPSSHAVAREEVIGVHHLHALVDAAKSPSTLANSDVWKSGVSRCTAGVDDFVIQPLAVRNDIGLSQSDLG